ncbi:MAG: hypothetical protein DRJ31_08375, partial [Candidatus Methanomethylicota archaeon]
MLDHVYFSKPFIKAYIRVLSGSPDVQVLYVNGEPARFTVFYDDFESYNPGSSGEPIWSPSPAYAWFVTGNGKYGSRGTHDVEQISVVDKVVCGDFTVEVFAQNNQEWKDTGLVFKLKNLENFYVFYLKTLNSPLQQEAYAYRVVDGVYTLLAKKVGLTFDMPSGVKMKVKVVGQVAYCYVNDL